MAAGSRTYFTEEDHAGVTSVTFGDGVHGSRVPTAASNVKTTYRSGIGAPGNVAPGKISQLSTRPLGVKDVINPLPATGGADADSLEQARRNVPIAVMSLDRLVSLPDYAFFTRNYGGVAKASASALSYGSSRMVHVTFATVGDAAVDPTSDFFNNLSDALVKFGDPLEPVQLARRSALLLVIKAEVRVLPDYLWENVSPVVRAAMLRKFGFDWRELEQDAVLSEVFSTIQSVVGVDYVKVDAFGAISDVDADGKPLTPDDLTKALKNLIQSADPAKLPSRIVANPARAGATGILPAQIAYLSSIVPDCLLLSELKP
jgi:predicted phage baseplate assembly protein